MSATQEKTAALEEAREPPPDLVLGTCSTAYGDKTGEGKEADERDTDSHIESECDPDEFLVQFEGDDDPFCPLNWSFRKKGFTTMMYACCTFGPQFSSSIYGPCVDDIARLYKVSDEVSTLGVSLFILGYVWVWSIYLKLAY